jgi:hypothetical protein
MHADPLPLESPLSLEELLPLEEQPQFAVTVTVTTDPDPLPELEPLDTVVTPGKMVLLPQPVKEAVDGGATTVTMLSWLPHEYLGSDGWTRVTVLSRLEAHWAWYSST